MNLYRKSRDLYYFPTARFVEESDLPRQVIHLGSEFVDFCLKLSWGRKTRADIEAADLYHSIETYFRMREREGLDVEALFKKVENKNQKRGYYHDARNTD